MATETVNWVGVRLSGRYDVTAQLGAGGMGVVYKARDRRLEADVVVKVPHPAVARDLEFGKRFQREVGALVRLAHPHIVGVLDLGSHDGLPFAVLQFLPGGSLRQRQGGDQAHAAGLRGWLPQVAAALDFVHGHRCIHRDVKPDNILFDRQGNAFLSDFGVVKVLASEEAKRRPTVLTGAGMVLGTPQFMAPELLLGTALDGRVDQYALAVTVYQTLTGGYPFDGPTAPVIFEKQINQPAPPLPQGPAALDGVLGKALAKNPRDRFPTCAAFAQAVLEAVGAVGPACNLPPGRQPRAGGDPEPWWLVGQVAKQPPGRQVENQPHAAQRQRTVPAHAPVPADPPPAFRPAVDTPRATRATAAAPPPLPPRRRRRRPFLVAAVAVLLVVGGIAVGAILYHRSHSGEAPAPPVAALQVPQSPLVQGPGETASAPQESPSSANGQAPAPGADIPPDLPVKMPPVVQPPPDKEPLPERPKPAPGLPPDPGPMPAPDPRPQSPTAPPILHPALQWEAQEDVVHCLAWSADGRVAVSVGISPKPGAYKPPAPEDSLVRVWDMPAGKLRRQLRGHTSHVQGVAVSADGRRVVSVSLDRTARVWDADEGKELLCYTGHHGPVDAVALSPDGRCALSGGADRDVLLWEIATGRTLHTFKGHTGIVQAVTFSPNRRQVVSAGTDGTVRLWDADSGAEVRRFEGNGLAVHSVCFSPDGDRLLASAANGLWEGERWVPARDNLRCWEVETGKLLASFHLSAFSNRGCTAFSPDGRHALAGHGSILRLYDLREGKVVVQLESGRVGDVVGVAFSPDGRHALSGGFGKMLRLWDLPEPGPLVARPAPPDWSLLPPVCNLHRECVWAVAPTPDGKSVFTAGGGRWVAGQLAPGKENVVLRWDLGTFAQGLRLDDGGKEIRTLAVDADGGRLLTGGPREHLALWNARTGKQTARLTLLGGVGDTASVAFAPKPRAGLAASAGTRLVVWNLAAGAHVWSRTLPDLYTNRIAFSPNGKVLVSGGNDGLLRSWDVQTGTEGPLVGKHENIVWQVAFLPDGNRVVSCSGGKRAGLKNLPGADNTVRLWDLRTGQQVGPPLLSGRDAIVSVAVSADGSRLATGEADGTVRLWDLAARRELAKWLGHTAAVRGLAFLADGRVISCSDDATVRVWTPPAAGQKP